MLYVSVDVQRAWIAANARNGKVNAASLLSWILAHQQSGTLTALPDPTPIPPPTPGPIPPVTGEGKIYVISPAGSDTAGDGTEAKPFATLPKLNGIGKPDDLVLMRGKDGPFEITGNRGWMWTSSGAAGHMIRVFAYPGDPQVEINAAKCTAPLNTYPGALHAGGNGIQCRNVSYVHWRGIWVRKAPMDGMQIIGEAGGSAIGNIVEHSIFSENGRNGEVGNGLAVYGYADKNLLLNDDAFGNRNSAGNGTNADGFQCSTYGGDSNVGRGLRSWCNGDDGLDCVSLWKDQIHGGWTFEDIWAWLNGYLMDGVTPTSGDGRGVKPGYIYGIHAGKHKFSNLKLWSNKVCGFDENDHDVALLIERLVAFDNNRANVSPGYYGNVQVSNTKAVHTIRDSASLLPAHGVHAMVLGSVSINNTWDAGHAVPTPADFLSIDPKTAMGPRKPDGSLPDTDFLKLAA